MLLRLHIKNLVLIERLELEFGEGLNAISGETGAGKTLLVQALGLLFGRKADSALVRTGAKSAEVSAVLEPDSAHPLVSILEELGVPVLDDGVVLIRRVVLASGKSRAYINDTPVTVSALRKIASLVADISSQREQQVLLDEPMHILLLDEFASLSELREQVSAKWQKAREIRAAIERLRQNARERALREEFLRYQIDEIDSLGLYVGEDEELLKERRQLMNAEEIYSALAHAEQLLYSGEIAASTLAEQAASKLDRAIELGAEHVQEVASMVHDASSVLADAARELGSLVSRIEPNPERLTQIEERLSAIDAVVRKHGPTIADVLDARNRMAEELDELAMSEQNVERLESELHSVMNELGDLALELSQRRKDSARVLEERLNKELRELAMPDASFHVQIGELGPMQEVFEVEGTKIGRFGMDAVRFLFSANASVEPRPLTKVASGGELSRIMLAMKSVLIEPAPALLLLFDEIDAGIGGKTARLVGKKLAQLARHRQVLCITHLPQIAAMANTHFVVEKHTKDGVTTTRIRKLSTEERPLEIARMLSGGDDSESAIEHARELLDESGR